jgi:hypothetical protein
MHALLRRRPSPAMVVASIALLVALGGTSIAAVSALPARSVGTKQLKNKAVTNAKLANGAVTAAKVKKGTLLKINFRAGQLPAGPKGATGPQGPAGVIGDVVLHSDSVTVPGSAEGNGSYFTRQVSANCGSNEKGITGGTFWSGAADDKEQVTVYSRPLYDSVSKRVTGWEARGGNDTVPNRVFTVYVVCAT